MSASSGRDHLDELPLKPPRLSSVQWEGVAKPEATLSGDCAQNLGSKVNDHHRDVSTAICLWTSPNYQSGSAVALSDRGCGLGFRGAPTGVSGSVGSEESSGE